MDIVPNQIFINSTKYTQQSNTNIGNANHISYDKSTATVTFGGKIMKLTTHIQYDASMHAPNCATWVNEQHILLLQMPNSIIDLCIKEKSIVSSSNILILDGIMSVSSFNLKN